MKIAIGSINDIYETLTGADPGFVVRGGGGGGVSRRGVWRPHTVPSGSRAEPR